jgi:hypothetical protein
MHSRGLEEPSTLVRLTAHEGKDGSSGEHHEAIAHSPQPEMPPEVLYMSLHRLPPSKKIPQRCLILPHQKLQSYPHHAFKTSSNSSPARETSKANKLAATSNPCQSPRIPQLFPCRLEALWYGTKGNKRIGQYCDLGSDLRGLR